ncbi:MAG: hypothetical protein CMK09_16925 [Ponticaulis sp.]|nr:hypothetical protein [Ponticaulis sp.]
MSRNRFPIGAEFRMAVSLRILKAALVPYIPDQITASGETPNTALPPSSPVRKHGFEHDVRAALHLLSNFGTLFCDEPISPHIRSLSRLRDRWAHQQELTEEDVTRFCRIGAELLDILRRDPEARALRQLTTQPDAELANEIEWFRERTHGGILTFEEMQAELGLDDGVQDAVRLHRALIWDAVLSVMLNGTPLCLLTVLSRQDAPSPDETGLPGASFWWVLNLPHDAPLPIRRAAWKSWHADLAGPARDA